MTVYCSGELEHWPMLRRQ